MPRALFDRNSSPPLTGQVRLRRDFEGSSSLDLYDEDTVPALAKKYGVSTQALE